MNLSGSLLTPLPLQAPGLLPLKLLLLLQILLLLASFMEHLLAITKCHSAEHVMMSMDTCIAGSLQKASKIFTKGQMFSPPHLLGTQSCLGTMLSPPLPYPHNHHLVKYVRRTLFYGKAGIWSQSSLVLNITPHCTHGWTTISEGGWPSEGHFNW